MNKHRKNQPLVSVIMPVYNAGKFLVEAIESIRNQTYQNWELIAVNDCSTDDSWEILKRYAKKDKRIKVFKNKTKGYLAGSLNFALQKAKGKYFARMDADDISLPWRLEKQVEMLENNHNLVAVGGQEMIIDEEGNIIGEKFFPQDPKECYRKIFNYMVIQPPALMTRASVMKRLRYDTGIAKNDDIDMHFQLLQYGDFSNVDEFVLQYRKRGNSVTFSNVKGIFFMAAKVRLRAIWRYGYRPYWANLFVFLAEAVLVLLLPTKAVIWLFEFFRVRRKVTLPSPAPQPTPAGVVE